MNEQPKPQRIDDLLCIEVATMVSMAVLLENGPGFSVLICQHVNPMPHKGYVLFEDCINLRIEKDGTYQIRSFSSVVVMFDSDRGAWIASPDDFETLFLQPSIDCYAVVELTRQESKLILEACANSEISFLFAFFRNQYKKLPRFCSSSATVLEAGEHYASAMDLYVGECKFI